MGKLRSQTHKTGDNHVRILEAPAMTHDANGGRPGLLSLTALEPQKRHSWRTRDQWFVFASVSAAMLVLTEVLSPSADEHFRRFLGSADPLFVVAAMAVLGGSCLAVLRLIGRLEILKGPTTLRGMGFSAVAATLLASAIIVADFIVRYPEDINVPVPEALLFYPVIGFVAEIFFHVLPMAVLSLAGQLLCGRMSTQRMLWIAMALAAGTEPTFQVTFMADPFSWAAVYTWFHVFVIACLQLYVFRRFDFISMYSFRLFYYAYWHIIWGVIRIQVLF